jgi:hypothetical protein
LLKYLALTFAVAGGSKEDGGDGCREMTKEVRKQAFIHFIGY